MVQVQTRLKVADNSGAKEVQIIKCLGGSKKRYARIGELVVVSAKSVDPSSSIKKGKIMKAVIVRSKKAIKRKNGMVLRFGDNACVIVKDDFSLVGTRVFGPVAREIRDKGFAKIASLAPEVV